jgi:hypothetical protein
MNIPCHLHYFLPGLDTLPSIPKYQEAWATWDSCRSTTRPTISHPPKLTTVKEWECSSDSCSTRTAVKGYTVIGLGHSWPNTEGLDNDIALFDAHAGWYCAILWGALSDWGAQCYSYMFPSQIQVLLVVLSCTPQVKIYQKNLWFAWQTWKNDFVFNHRKSSKSRFYRPALLLPAWFLMRSHMLRLTTRIHVGFVAQPL